MFQAEPLAHLTRFFLDLEEVVFHSRLYRIAQRVSPTVICLLLVLKNSVRSYINRQGKM